MHYPGNAGTSTADLLTMKLLINSIISTEGARFQFHIHATPQTNILSNAAANVNAPPPNAMVL